LKFKFQHGFATESDEENEENDLAAADMQSPEKFGQKYDRSAENQRSAEKNHGSSSSSS
jgi:hypothetical protein